MAVPLKLPSPFSVSIRRHGDTWTAAKTAKWTHPAVVLATGLRGSAGFQWPPEPSGRCWAMPLAWGVSFIDSPWIQAAGDRRDVCRFDAVLHDCRRATWRQKDPGAIVLDEIVSLPVTSSLVRELLDAAAGPAGRLRGCIDLFDITQAAAGAAIGRLPSGLGHHGRRHCGWALLLHRVAFDLAHRMVWTKHDRTNPRRKIAGDETASGHCSRAWSSSKSGDERHPCLAAVLVGEDPASDVYVRNKQRGCERRRHDESTCIGCQRDDPELNCSRSLPQLNDRRPITRCMAFLVQLPLPKHINETKILDAVQPLKDVDAISSRERRPHRSKAGRDFCLARRTVFNSFWFTTTSNTAGKHVVVLGRSEIVGKPMAARCSCSAAGADATVTICHSRTQNLAEITRQADVLIVAIGKPRFVTADMVRARGRRDRRRHQSRRWHTVRRRRFRIRSASCVRNYAGSRRRGTADDHDVARKHARGGEAAECEVNSQDTDTSARRGGFLLRLAADRNQMRIGARYIRPSAIAGVARVPSPSEFFASSLYSFDACQHDHVAIGDMQ